MTPENHAALRAYFEEQSRVMKEKRAAAALKAKKTRQYIKSKPDCIIQLQNDMFYNKHKQVSYDDRTANGLTAFILDWLEYNGHYGARINIGGIYLAESGKYRASGSTKGVADVIACINGKFCQFEVKVGKDRPREDQLIQQRLTRQAGGIYEFVHNATEFVEYANKAMEE